MYNVMHVKKERFDYRLAESLGSVRRVPGERIVRNLPACAASGLLNFTSRGRFFCNN